MITESKPHWSEDAERRTAWLAEVYALIDQIAAENRAAWRGRDSLTVIEGGAQLTARRGGLHVAVPR